MLLGLAFALLVAESACTAAASAGFEVDRGRGEVRFPCRFVNPTRQIEVFACHASGPTHETVVEFDATGPEIAAALRQIGCRSADFWNATSAGDFLRNQGDRVLVLVRWTHRGVERELPAEAMLLDGDTGFPSFVRGFSFSALGRITEPSRGAEPPPGSDLPEAPVPTAPPADSAVPAVPRGPPEIPVAVEITLGATSRQNAIFSLLSHPTTLDGQTGAPGLEPARALRPWIAPPLFNSAIVAELPALVEERTPATIVLRRVESEEALLRYVRSIASLCGVDDRLPLYERLEPLMKEIDRLKAAYLGIAAAIRTLLETRLDRLPDESHAEFAFRAEALQRLGRWYAARIQERYFQRYLEEEEFKLAWLAKQPTRSSGAGAGRGDGDGDGKGDGAAGLDPDARELARGAVEHGLRYEPLLAQQEVALARQALDELTIRGKMSGLELERWIRLGADRLAETEASIHQLDPADLGDQYRRRLFEEARLRIENSRAILAARRAHVQAVSEEIATHLGGEWTLRAPCIEARLELAEAQLAGAKLQNDLLGVLENLRWEEGDSDDGEEGVTERERLAREKLESLRRDEKALRATIDAASRDLAALEAKVKTSCGE
jgi:hypothetical protein